MIKIITLDSSSWDLRISVSSKTKIGGSGDVASKSQYWESSVLNSFIEAGYTIKDWKLSTTKGPDRTWTFILGKDNE